LISYSLLNPFASFASFAPPRGRRLFLGRRSLCILCILCTSAGEAPFLGQARPSQARPERPARPARPGQAWPRQAKPSHPGTLRASAEVNLTAGSCGQTTIVAPVQGGREVVPGCVADISAQRTAGRRANLPHKLAPGSIPGTPHIKRPEWARTWVQPACLECIQPARVDPSGPSVHCRLAVSGTSTTEKRPQAVAGARLYPPSPFWLCLRRSASSTPRWGQSCGFI
jgi:hypothetical protein